MEMGVLVFGDNAKLMGGAKIDGDYSNRFSQARKKIDKLFEKVVINVESFIPRISN